MIYAAITLFILSVLAAGVTIGLFITRMKTKDVDGEDPFTNQDNWGAY